MNRLVALLLATTLIFAGSTFYLMYELGQERERGQRAASPFPNQTAGAQAEGAGDNATPAPDPLEPVAALDLSELDAARDSTAPRDPGQLAVARHRLEQLHDPVARAEQAKQLMALFREDWRTIGPRIGVSSGELERLLARLTDLTLQGAERRVECQLDPSCDTRALESAPGMSLEDRVGAALSPQQLVRYKAFQEAATENTTVYWLNQQLEPANALTDATADRLVQALGEQRRQFIREAEARGEKVDIDSGEITIRAAAMAGASDEYARRGESATVYARRSVELASGLLTREQLAQYQQMVERRLYAYTERMRRAEIADAARKAADGR